MKHIKYLTIVLLGILVLFTSGCVPKANVITKGEKFPKMYDQQPRSLLILPPMNESTDAEAKDYYMTTVEMPFALMGYYVMPVEIVSDVMKQEGITNTEMLYDLPLNKLQEYFGADAVLYTRIKKWDTSYMVVASQLTVSVDSEIVSTKTSEKLWSYNGTVVQDLTSRSNGGGGLAELIINIAATAINTAAADYVKYARIANFRLISSVPVGPYHEMHMKDQGVQIVDQTPEK
ncbi:MAG: DUF799 family lipoprotein [Sulfurimonas sp.]|nr:DUF799 family lipoprotein [Sulfurimonas sp.]